MEWKWSTCSNRPWDTQPTWITIAWLLIRTLLCSSRPTSQTQTCLLQEWLVRTKCTPSVLRFCDFWWAVFLGWFWGWEWLGRTSYTLCTIWEFCVTFGGSHHQRQNQQQQRMYRTSKSQLQPYQPDQDSNVWVGFEVLGVEKRLCVLWMFWCVISDLSGCLGVLGVNALSFMQL